MPRGAITDWVDLLEEQARARGVNFERNPRQYFNFRLGGETGIIGKVRISEEQKREYEDHGREFIWHRYNREKELTQQNISEEVVNVTLDVWDNGQFAPDDDHFIFVREALVTEETHSQGDQRIEVLDNGRYGGPLSESIDDWDDIFQRTVTAGSADNDPSSAVPHDNSGGEESDTSGNRVSRAQDRVEISQSFKNEVRDRFNNKCALTGIEGDEYSYLLTVSHILDRADREDIAEDHGNVVLLNRTHHFAFDNGLWTFDKGGRIWIKPEYNPASDIMRDSLLDRDGEIIPHLRDAEVNPEYLNEHNSSLSWWPVE
ncbi:HNH endonuclease [Halorubrum sp. BOL3-1]|uniref:HNH endonuclease signature motif containing protein n=1 Tax=Halorubrum sp. BOL3-1 TaxID=2497325 RepID=UPI0010051540|nr:HNH endonuclease signature motif containing protein [Halorubrum sp. BOL3-1]QAU11659.1 HNH endonuclease [Halorubrum sp. BOL3-1]